MHRNLSPPTGGRAPAPTPAAVQTAGGGGAPSARPGTQQVTDPWSLTRWEQREIRQFLWWLRNWAPEFPGAVLPKDTGLSICAYHDDGEHISYDTSAFLDDDDALLAAYAARDRSKDFVE